MRIKSEDSYPTQHPAWDFEGLTINVSDCDCVHNANLMLFALLFPHRSVDIKLQVTI